MDILVISRNPPGGRCTLYARYAETLGKATGRNVAVIFSELGDAHGEGFPCLQLGGVAVQPGDGVILAPEDICSVLAAELEAEQLAAVTALMDAVLETFLAENSENAEKDGC